MEILSIRRGFASDHSSTSYEFLAVDKPLSKKDRSEVSRLSRRADPSARRVNFTYNVDGYDIPGGYEKLMANYYDVMYREEYSWWTLVIAFETSYEQYKELCAYEFDGTDDLGIRIITSVSFAETTRTTVLSRPAPSGCFDRSLSVSRRNPGH